jgi:magnesium transporter
MFRKQHTQIGARPGTLVISTDAQPTKIRVTRYSSEGIEELTTGLDGVDGLGGDFTASIDESHVTWIDIQGFGNVGLLKSIAEQFCVHPLAMESVINVPQRPQVALYGEQLLIVARMVQIEEGALDIRLPQVSIFVGPNYVVTVQDTYSEVLAPIRDRLEQNRGPMRNSGSDYLAYAILDTVVDGYYPALETIGEEMENLESQVIANPHPQLLSRVNLIRNRLVNMRRTIWPQRDAVNSLVHGDYGLIQQEVRTYLRDTLDHCVQTTEVVEMYRDMATGLLNTYLSSVAHRSNEVMKVLTIMSSIFVPLTFIAGIYGMNFENMPELSFRWAYPAVWLTMLTTAATLLSFFWWKGWIGISKLPEKQAEVEPVDYPPTAMESTSAATFHLSDHAPTEVTEDHPTKLKKAS